MCLPVTSLRRSQPIPTLALEEGDDMIEMFLNFHFSGFDTNDGIGKPSISGKKYVAPKYPPQVCELLLCTVIDIVSAHMGPLLRKL